MHEKKCVWVSRQTQFLVCTYVYGHKIRDKIDRQSKTLQSGLIVIELESNYVQYMTVSK